MSQSLPEPCKASEVHWGSLYRKAQLLKGHSSGLRQVPRYACVLHIPSSEPDTTAFPYEYGKQLYTPLPTLHHALQRHALGQAERQADLGVALGKVSHVKHSLLHQGKPTVPFITIDHYISLFVTFVAISAIIALWHP